MRILCLLGIAGLIAALAPAAAAQVASRCVTNCNYWVTGKRIAGSGEDAASADACQARCNANAACHGWMFWLPSNAMHPNMCELAGSEAATDYQPSTLAVVSGLKSRAAAAPTGAAARTSTFLAGKYWSDLLTVIPALKGKGARSCMAACIADGKCTAWDYQNDKGFCRHYDIPIGGMVLHNSPTVIAGAIVVGGAAPAPAAAAPPTAAPSPPAAAAPGAARRTSTLVKGRLWSPPYPFFHQQNNATAQSCAAMCVQREKCAAWHWNNAEGEGSCGLISSVPENSFALAKTALGVIRVGAPSAAAPQGTTVSPPPAGAPVRTSTFVRDHLWDPTKTGIYAGTPESSNSAQACMTGCIRDLKCKAWLYMGQTSAPKCYFIPDPKRLVKHAAGNDYVAGAIRQASPATDPGAAPVPPGIPSDPRQALAAGREAAGRADYQRAAELFTAALNSGNLDPASRLLAQRSRASALFNLKRYDQARADYDAVINAAPNDSDALWSRAFLLHTIGQGEAAMDDAERAVKANPRNRAAYSMRAVLRQANGNHDGAIADFTQVITFANTPADKGRAHATRGEAHYMAGHIDEALADFDRALNLNPEDRRSTVFRGYARIAAGRYDEARADFDSLAALAPTNPVPMRDRGLAEAARGNFELAAKDFVRYGTLAPADHYAHMLAYVAAERSGQWAWPDLARAAARLDLKKWPAPTVHHLLGNLGAEALMAAAKHDDPKIERTQVCEAEFYIGQAALLSGDKAGARRRFERAAAVCPPNFVEAIWAKAELARPASQP